MRAVKAHTSGGCLEVPGSVNRPMMTQWPASRQPNHSPKPNSDLDRVDTPAARQRSEVLESARDVLARKDTFSLLVCT